MSAPHLLAPSIDGDRVEIEGDDAHHAVRVLRLKPGERVTVSDGEGAIADGIIESAGKTLVVGLSGRRSVGREAPFLSVLQGIPKSGKLELIVQKLTEVGVDEIIPLKAARSIPRWDAPGKVARLRAVAREASKQSHRAWIPSVGDPVNVANVANVANGTMLILHEEADAKLLDVLPSTPPDRMSVLVGPEGGFARDEIEALARVGVPVTLGNQILRTETAGLVAITLILGQYRRIG